MHICPACKHKIIGKSKKMTFNRYTRYCPNCGVLLRKKFSPWFIIIIIPFAISVANFKTHWIFGILTVIFAVVVLVAFSILPYERYDNKK